MHIIKQNFRIYITSVIVLCLITITGCQSMPKDVFKLQHDTLENRVMQSRKYFTNDEASLLTAATNVLQDLGYNLDESETKLGILVGSKTRDATNSGQVVCAVALAILGGGVMPIDTLQKIRISIVTKPSIDNSFIVRAVFQRIVWNTRGYVTQIEAINSAEIYQNFFAELDKALFLEGHNI
jgi:hypothetical protein